MTQTITRHNKFFQGGSATSFLPKRKYAVSLQTGSTSGAKYLTIPNPDLITTGDCSIVFAVRYPTNTGVGCLKVGVPGVGFTIRLAQSGTFRINFGTVGFDTNRDLADGEWHIIVVTFDRDGDLSWFEDDWITNAPTTGDEITVDISQQTHDIEDGNDWLFGYRGSGNNYAHCEYDEIAFYDYKFTSVGAYLAYLYMKNGADMSGGGTGLPLPTNYWKCNEGEGTVLNDKFGNENIDMINFGGGSDGWIEDGLS